MSRPAAGSASGAVRTLRRVLLWVFLAVAVIAVVRFFDYADRFPYVATDDALVNVSYTLATEGRYGCTNSPIQSPGGTPRYDRFFNYGPWYFWIAAGWIQLVGFSLVAVRFLHLLAMIGVGLLAFVSFARASRWSGSSLHFEVALGSVVAAACGLAVLFVFHRAQWPMVRPDSFVAFFTVLHLVTVSIALRRRSSVGWFFAGLFAAMAAWSHLIAASVVVTCGINYAFAAYLDARDRGAGFWRIFFGPSFFSVVAGGVFATLQFFVAAGVTVAEFSAWIGAYSELIAKELTLAEVLERHFDHAFWSLPTLQTAFFVSIGIAFLNVGIALRRQRSGGAFVFTDQLPALVTTIGYVSGLSFYSNAHSGYAILLQVLALWLMATIAVDGGIRFSAAAPVIRRGLVVVTGIAVFAFAFTLGRDVVRGDFSSFVASRSHPSFERFCEEVLETVPPGGTVWGEVYFGLESPHRAEYMVMSEALDAIEKIPVEARSDLIAEQLVWGQDATTRAIRRELRGEWPLALRVDSIDPATSFEIEKLVHAAPYQTTRIRRRVPVLDSATIGDRPAVALYSARLDRWTRELDETRTIQVELSPAGEISGAACAETSPASLAGAERRIRASRTFVATVEPGVWLLRIDFARADAPVVPASVSSGRREPWFFVGDQPSYDDPATLVGVGHLAGADASFPFPGERASWLAIERRTAGPIHFSVIDPAGLLRLQAITLAPALYPTRPTAPPDARSLPEPTPESWVLSAGLERRVSGSTVHVIGDDSAYRYQLMSPPIAVEPRHELEVALDLEIESGPVAVGVLDSAGAWLLPASRPVSTKRHVVRADTGEHSSVRIVIANLGPEGPTEFRLLHATARLRSSSETPYIERLLGVSGDAP